MRTSKGVHDKYVFNLNIFKVSVRLMHLHIACCICDIPSLSIRATVHEHQSAKQTKGKCSSHGTNRRVQEGFETYHKDKHERLYVCI